MSLFEFKAPFCFNDLTGHEVMADFSSDHLGNVELEGLRLGFRRMTAAEVKEIMGPLAFADAMETVEANWRDDGLEQALNDEITAAREDRMGD